MQFFCFIVFPSYEISPSEFTCTASSSYNSSFTCENIYTKSKNGWIANETGEGSWVKIEFHGIIQISKIIYRHNDKLPGKCCNQNFKDISFQFSDGTMANVTVDDVFDSDTNIDLSYRIDTPKLTTNLLIMANSVYNHTIILDGLDGSQVENGGKPIYAKNSFGISNIRIWGTIKTGTKVLYE